LEVSSSQSHHDGVSSSFAPTIRAESDLRTSDKERPEPGGIQK
jgi:hypothetical protein